MGSEMCIRDRYHTILKACFQCQNIHILYFQPIAEHRLLAFHIRLQMVAAFFHAAFVLLLQFRSRFLWQQISGCNIDRIPFLSGQRNVTGLYNPFNARSIDRAQNHLHLSRMAEQPCCRNRTAADLIFLC